MDNININNFYNCIERIFFFFFNLSSNKNQGSIEIRNSIIIICISLKEY